MVSVQLCDEEFVAGQKWPWSKALGWQWSAVEASDDSCDAVESDESTQLLRPAAADTVGSPRIVLCYLRALYL
eukprot:SAG31_NODE_17613_length_664_cov_1.030088_1_plen_72_part_10